MRRCAAKNHFSSLKSCVTERGSKFLHASQVIVTHSLEEKLAVGLGSEISPGTHLQRNRMTFSEERALWIFEGKQSLAMRRKRANVY